MNDNILTLGKVLDHLREKNLLDQAGLDRIAKGMKRAADTSKDPLYIRLLSGIGAWVAALFFIGFLAISQIIIIGMEAVICGILLLAAGILIALRNKGTFASQLALALAFSGNILVLLGIREVFHVHGISALVIVQAIVCTFAYPLFPNYVYRFFAPAALVILIMGWIIQSKASELIHILIAAEMIFAGRMLLLRKRHALLDPLVYSAATLLPLTILLMSVTRMNLWRGGFVLAPDFQQSLWPSSFILALGLIYLLLALTGGMQALRERWMILAIPSILLLGIFSMPGILVATGLLIVGYAFEDRALTGLAYVFFPCFLFLLYYSLDITLAHKSWMIASNGVVLLVVRWLVGHWEPEEGAK